MAYCDFCTCEDCQNGTEYIKHAKTEDGRWICDVCFEYDLCTIGPHRNWAGPCENHECIHRPRLVTEFEK